MTEVDWQHGGLDDESAEGDLPDPMHEADDVLLYCGDSLEVMRAMPAKSVDCLVSDPPYGLEFMGNQWDSFRVDDQRHPRWAGERAGAQGDFTNPGMWGDKEWASELPTYGGKRPKTSRCTGCGKRDAFRNPHECVEGAEWEPIFTYEPSAPPSMLAFQEWTRQWATEAFRILKPGGWLIAFSGTRTYHRTAAGIEDAGFEIRDMVEWFYGSGFPKSLNVGLAIDGELGVEHEIDTRMVDVTQATLEDQDYGLREEVATRTSGIGTAFDADNGTWAQGASQEFAVKKPGSPEGKEWEGWGTALKPGHEPCVVARKPFAVTVARNVLDHGTGAMNINGASISTGGERVTAGLSDPSNREGLVGKAMQAKTDKVANNSAQLASLERTYEFGRWPANVIVQHSSECVPRGSGAKRGDGHYAAGAKSEFGGLGGGGEAAGPSGLPEEVELYDCASDCPVLALDRHAGTMESRLRVGGAGPARFFYVPKPSASEKDAGLTAEEFPPLEQLDATHPTDGPGASNPRNRSAKRRLNNHPTVKPIDMMRWLVRLVTPPGGVVLDPFMGSGTTGCAAVIEGAKFIGIDLDERHVRIARARIEHWRPKQSSLF